LQLKICTLRYRHCAGAQIEEEEEEEKKEEIEEEEEYRFNKFHESLRRIKSCLILTQTLTSTRLSFHVDVCVEEH
jgi:hypothetical protein